MNLRRGKRRLALFAALIFAYFLSGRVMGISVDTAAAPDTAAYRMSTPGKSSLRKFGNETFLELNDGVRIVHGDVVVTADSGAHFTARKYTRFAGNVVIRQETMTMWGDEGEYDQPRDLAVLRRNVRIVEEGWEVTCDEARYSRATGKAWLIGNVIAKDSTTTMRSDRMLYDRNREFTEAFSRLQIANPGQGFFVQGSHGTFDRVTREGVIDRDPHLIVDPDTPEPVTVDSDTMRVYPDSGRAVAYYRVKIIKGSTVTQCDSAALFDDQQRVELYGNPLARQQHLSMRGSAMTLHYNDEEIHRIDIHGQAGIRDQQPDTLIVGRDSWIEGDSMSLYLHENTVDSIHVAKGAQSEYYPSTPNKVEANLISGDGMFFRFERDTLSYVRVVGNAKGNYRYLDLNGTQTADSLRALLDTNLVYVPFAPRAQEVSYSGRQIEYYADTRDLVLRGGARINYGGSQLTGERITYFSALQLLDATGEPVLTEGGQTFYGDRMDYDMDSETGLVSEGSTQFQQGYYTGREVAKVGEDEMKVWHSHYTTCDLAEPHYHFAAKEMKVYADDKVFSGPIVLYVGQTPVFYLPFLANTIRRGRHSGFLRPDFEFGVTSDNSRFIRNVGYYWATNDYTDFTFVADFNEDRSTRLYIQNRYALRYKFTGNVDLSLFRDLQTYRNEWTLAARHGQTLGDRFNLNGDLRFVSSDRAPQSVNTIDDVDRYIDRSIRSNVSLRKSWGSTAFSASASRTQNLNVTDSNALIIDETLPDVRLSIPSRNLYFGETSRSGDEGLWEKILTKTTYSPSLGATRRRTEKEFEFRETRSGTAGLALRSPQKVGFASISPQVSARMVTTRTDFEQLQHLAADSTTVPYDQFTTKDNTFTWNTGVGANTNFFGTFYPHIGRLRGLRHTISPAANYTLTPAQAGRPRSQIVTLSLRNAIDLKLASSDEPPAEGEEEQVTKLSGVLLWSLATSYNPDPQVQGAMEWSNVSSALNVNIARVGLSLNHVIDPYLGDIQSTSATSRFQITGTHPFGYSSDVEVRELNVVAASDTSQDDNAPVATIEQTGDVLAPDQARDLAIEEGRLPWSIAVDLSYAKSINSDPRSTMRVSSSIDITKAWKISYSTIYDVTNRAQTGQNFSISRDLHCWAMSFNRQRLGDEWQFYFKITLRGHPELFGEAGQRGLGGGTFGVY